MGSYHVWQPSWIEEAPATLECFVTLGEALWLARGDDKVVVAVLKVLGVESAPTTWHLTPGRSHYFTSYYEDATEWQDKWSLAWRLRCELPRSTPLPDLPVSGFLDVEFVDSSYDGDHDPEDDGSWRCWVVADFRNRPSDADVRAIAPSKDTVWGSAYARYPQLRIDLGERSRDWYEAGADDAEQMLTKLRSAGASTRFHETRDWYAADRG